MSSDVVLYDGHEYIISEKRITQENDKTKTPECLILTLFVIGQELLKNPQIRDTIKGEGRGRNGNEGREPEQSTQIIRIELLTGLPPEQFNNKETRQSFIKYFTDKGVFDFKFNNIPLRIEIVKVRVYCQGYAAVFTISEELEDVDDVNIIDIGGHTVDILLLVKGRIDADNFTSLQRGIDFLYRKINKRIRNMGGRHEMRSGTIENILKKDENTLKNYDKERVKAVDEEAREFATELLKTISGEGLDLIRDKTLFVGGGSILLKDYLTDYLIENDAASYPFFADNQFANAQGYQLIYEMQTEMTKAPQEETAGKAQANS